MLLTREPHRWNILGNNGLTRERRYVGQACVGGKSYYWYGRGFTDQTARMNACRVTKRQWESAQKGWVSVRTVFDGEWLGKQW